MQFDRFMVISWSEEDGLFVDHFPKNTELYKIMTTKPQDLALQSKEG